MPAEILFREKQYLGRNTYGLSRRLVILVFCIIAHFYSEEKSDTTGLFLLVGLFTVLLSLILLFVPLYTIQLDQRQLVLKSLLRRSVSIPLSDILHAGVVKYSRYHFNNPVFHVFAEGEYKFYAEGSGAILLDLKGGKIYRIGTKQANELQIQIEKTKSGNTSSGH